ncbi:MAG TPA: peptidase M14, partial [Roseiflexaceae bacterium]|nr:peptidase M14 [Roseiflexaceae bacterium]
GPPLGPPAVVGALTRQHFERAALELHTDLADTPYLVQPALLGSRRQQEAGYKGLDAPPCDVSLPSCRLFPETGLTVGGAFLSFWEREGGLAVFGYPVSAEFQAVAADGQVRTVQRFERAVFAYYPEDSSVRLEPLGWADLLRTRAQAPTLPHQVR